jgi:hypothetical protein
MRYIWPERFSNKVDIRGPDDCWLWTACLIPNGYGQFWFEGRMHNAHVMAVKFSGIEVPDDHVVMHSCDNRPCCNTKHLLVARQINNIEDMVKKNRNAKGITHGCAILSEQDVRAIRERRETAADAAATYGVSRATINDIRQYLSWKHLMSC